MNMPEIIQKKKEGRELAEGEIRFFTDGYNKGIIPDYQMSALFMAVYFSGMTQKETSTLALEMAATGDTLEFPGIDGVKVDKHSSGGVGDKTTLIVGPMVASCGLTVAKMSGRGLGFSGGTIDKLEAIKGFKAELSAEKFIKLAKDNGLVITGQTKKIAPVDKKMYALRDVTATVDNMSLIAASIMSKKLALKSDAIVLDVKTGRGAFMKTYDEALTLSKMMVSIGESAKRKTVAIITNMDEPLGNMVGNALEIKEAVSALRGDGPEDLMQVCFALGAEMLVLGKLAKDRDAALKMLENSIKNGKAFDKFLSFIKAQEGDTDVILDTEKLPKAPYSVPIFSESAGFICAVDAEEIGLASVTAGAGRHEKDEIIDCRAGIELLKKTGQSVKKGDVLAYVHSGDAEKADNAAKRAAGAYKTGVDMPIKGKTIRAIVKIDGVESFE